MVVKPRPQHKSAPRPLDIEQPIRNVDDHTLRAALEASRSPLILTDNQRTDNVIIYSNQAFLDLTGYSMAEVVGRNCRFLQGPDTNPKTVSRLRDAIGRNAYVRVDIKNYRKDGTAFWNDLVMSPILDDKGTAVYFMGMQLDITDRIESQSRLKAQTAELQRTNHELEQFTYAASHDLQEPLRMVNSYLQLINKRYGDKLDEDALTFLNFATEGAVRMQDLISDLLTLSRVSSSTERFKTAKLAEVIDRALFNLRLMIEESGAKVTVGPMPAIQADPVQLTQLFQNLIGNAIKYRAKDRPPEITVTAVKKGKNYLLAVADNGIGIAPQHFERIFTIFQRLHTRNEYGGTGVGLAICAKIAERHGGKLWVESQPGSGSKFFCSLPAGEGGKRNRRVGAA